MGIDYDGVGGIGVEFDDEKIKKMIKKGVFTEEEWGQDKAECMEKIGILFSPAGNYYSGDIRYYFFVSGETLQEINKNAPAFIKVLSEAGIDITEKDLIVIDDILIS